MQNDKLKFKIGKRIPCIILASIIAALPLYLFRFAVAGVPTNVFEVVLYAAFLVWLWYRWQKGRSSTSSDNNYSLSEGSPKSKGYHINWRLSWVVWTWILVGLIAALVNPDWLSGLGYWRAYFFDPMLVYLIIANEYQSARIVIPRALITVGFIVGAISLAGFGGWNIAADGRWLGWFGFEPFASPNYLSLFLVPILAISLIAMWTWQGWWRYVAVVSTLVMVIALWGTGSRGALVGIIGGVIIALTWWYCRSGGAPPTGVGGTSSASSGETLRSTSPFAKATGGLPCSHSSPNKSLEHSAKEGKNKYQWLWLSAIVLVVLAVATFWLAKPDFMATPADGRVATSNNIRWYIWQTSAEIIKSKPLLGVGLGNYQNYFTELTKNRVNYPEFIAPLAYSAHNLYVHILATMGIVGLIVFIWLLATIIKTISNTKPTSEQAIIVAALASILLYGLVDTPYFKNDLALLWWILVALVVSLNNKTDAN